MGLEGLTGQKVRQAEVDQKVRRAEVADAAALVGLRAQMLADMGQDVGGEDDPWRASALEWFADRLGDRQEFAAFVIDDPAAGVVASAAGVCVHHAPGPGNVSGVRGHVFNMSSAPTHRRLGYARACLEALLAWFADETEARVINLFASQDGIALYRSLGFDAPQHPGLELRLTRPS